MYVTELQRLAFGKIQPLTNLIFFYLNFIKIHLPLCCLCHRRAASSCILRWIYQANISRTAAVSLQIFSLCQDQVMKEGRYF